MSRNALKCTPHFNLNLTFRASRRCSSTPWSNNWQKPIDLVAIYVRMKWHMLGCNFMRIWCMQYFCKKKHKKFPLTYSNPLCSRWGLLVNSNWVLCLNSVSTDSTANSSHAKPDRPSTGNNWVKEDNCECVCVWNWNSIYAPTDLVLLRHIPHIFQALDALDSSPSTYSLLVSTLMSFKHHKKKIFLLCIFAHFSFTLLNLCCTHFFTSNINCPCSCYIIFPKHMWIPVCAHEKNEWSIRMHCMSYVPLLLIFMIFFFNFVMRLIYN
jgi:hypothetical protein